MKKGKLLSLGLGLLLVFILLSDATLAQEQESELYLIYDIMVNPSKVLEYENALKKEIAIYSKHGARLPDFIASTDDFHYYLAASIDNFAGLDNLYKEFTEAQEKMGNESYQAILKSYDGTYESVRPFMWYLRHDLSYSPENPRIKTEEEGFAHYTFIYLKAGMENAAEKIAKKWKTLYRSKAITDGYSLWVGDIGTDMPVYCVVSMGKNQADFYAQENKHTELLGNDAAELNKETSSVIRKIDIKTGRPRPDLLEITQK